MMSSEVSITICGPCKNRPGPERTQGGVPFSRAKRLASVVLPGLGVVVAPPVPKNSMIMLERVKENE